MTPDDDRTPIEPDQIVPAQADDGDPAPRPGDGDDPFAHIVQSHGIADDDDPTPRPSDGDDPFAALLGGGDAGIDFGALMETAGNLQAQLLAAQAAAAEEVVEGVAGGGAVKICVSGGHVFQSVEIRPDAVDPDDVEMLQDLVLAALHDASERIEALQAQSVDLKGLGLPDLFGGGGGLGA